MLQILVKVDGRHAARTQFALDGRSDPRERRREGGLWLEETLLADVPHRQVVLAVPKRFRPYLLHNRALLGELARVAARRTITAFIRTTVGEPGLSIQTHGSLANWHPPLHLLVTDGGRTARHGSRIG